MSRGSSEATTPGNATDPHGRTPAGVRETSAFTSRAPAGAQAYLCMADRWCYHRLISMHPSGMPYGTKTRDRLRTGEGMGDAQIRG